MFDEYYKCLELNISETCNYNCSYCVFRRNINENTLMTPDLARKVTIDYIEYLDGRKGKIYLGAGEPTLNWKAIEAVSDTLLSYQNTDVSIFFMSNGSCITENRMRFLKERDIKMGLSIDGHRSFQNIQRPHLGSGTDTYDAVIRTLELAKRYQYSIYSLSSTYRSPEFRDEVKHIIGLCKKYNINELDLDYDIAALTPLSIERVAENLIASYNDIVKENIQVFGYWIIPVLNKYEETSNRYYCGNSVGNCVCVSAAGNLKICGYDQTDYGLYCGFDQIKTNKKYVDAIKHYNENARSHECLKCELRSLCCGQCIFIDPDSQMFRNNCTLLGEVYKRNNRPLG